VTEPAGEGRDDLYCARDNTHVSPNTPRCPYPSSHCEFRATCPVRDAERQERRSADAGDG
jgi:hypothetical protein